MLSSFQLQSMFVCDLLQIFDLMLTDVWHCICLLYFREESQYQWKKEVFIVGTIWWLQKKKKFNGKILEK